MIVGLGVLVLVSWAALCVGFVIGGLWVSLFAERRIRVLEADIAAMDHARYKRREGRQTDIADEADMAITGDDW